MNAACRVNGQPAGTRFGRAAWYSFIGMPQPTTPSPDPQSAGAVLMVRPAGFTHNPQTASSNEFQSRVVQGAGVQGLALREFDDLAELLTRAGVLVLVAADTPLPVKPDAVFPNNWVSFHRDGTVVLYPMMAPNRRTERREDLLERVTRDGGYRASRTVDLSHREHQGQFLEGTGSMVLDRVNRLAYATLSARTDLDVLGEFAQQLDYELVTFEAFDARLMPIYHTNVMLAIGARFAVVCSEAITDLAHRAAVVRKLLSTGHDVIEISRIQMGQFAGNVLELAPPGGNAIAMSRTAWHSFDSTQRRVLEGHGSVVIAEIPTIERVGGGGVRCMLAEIHLPTR